jgi:hypothetical protein
MGAMAQALAFARAVEFSSFGALRSVIVTSCALTLIAAGPAVPAFGF